MINKIFIILSIGLFCFSFKVDAQTNLKASSKKDVVKSYQIGDKVDDFSMKNVDGKMYSLKDIENAKGYILIFTSNTCPFAVAYEDRMIELNNKMAPKGYPVVAINPNDPAVESGDSFDAMVTNYDEKNFPYLYLKDEASIYSKFGANKTPHVFLVDSDFVLRYTGAIDDNANDADGVEERFVENAIAAIEKGEDPNPATTKAVGCGIKVAGAKGGKRGGRRGPPSADMLLSRMDADKDNMISKAEAEGPLAGDFDSLDANNDGKLSKDELSKIKGGKKGGKPRGDKKI
ncbi:thioredoxin family protein [Saprospiraceae bacterium]|nr:thioredoxin family protein [Saprospiraceae bacterium]